MDDAIRLDAVTWVVVAEWSMVERWSSGAAGRLPRVLCVVVPGLLSCLALPCLVLSAASLVLDGSSKSNSNPTMATAPNGDGDGLVPSDPFRDPHASDTLVVDSHITLTLAADQLHVRDDELPARSVICCGMPNPDCMSPSTLR